MIASGKIDEMTSELGKIIVCGPNTSTKQNKTEADKFVWLMSDHSLIDIFNIERDRNNKTLTWRIILATGTKINWQDLRSYAKNAHARIEIGFSHEIIAGIALNEKMAGLLLPDLRGSLDFNSGFISNSPFFVSGARISLIMFGIDQRRQ